MPEIVFCIFIIDRNCVCIHNISSEKSSTIFLGDKTRQKRPTKGSRLHLAIKHNLIYMTQTTMNNNKIDFVKFVYA